MYILSRAANERIVIDLDDGRQIEILVVGPGKNGRTRIGITAPRATAIHRGEVWDMLFPGRGVNCEELAEATL